ncbi:enoyl-CoA hydratase/isomerase family protein [Bradyrhizobium sp. Ash2021]|uniref:enoyl-CoA hydratase/isomerase family protein n=1 Tax=Bradyrhizobium sp. Ash2021 TaxID=2954771 RepID=UPI002815F19E|nr:enoyl-CoA hydratase/isomerase family protein [Bradyrhizobium sp. Ash2021]WMT75952.1 enoyl-CoA hydratase/isomerase family protein [Bradyrhizobium sp. Ash2021]
MSISVTEPQRHIVLVTIENEGRRNALTRAMFEELALLWPRLEASTARCVVVTGQGSKAFCSGAGLSIDWTLDPNLDDLVDRALLKTQTFTKPLVAAINGHAVAGGLEFVLSCDIRIAARGAKLGFPEVQWGIFPSGGGALKLEGQIGYTWARDLLLTGRLITADEANTIGLVGQVVVAQDVRATAMQRAESIARNSPTAVAAVKRFLSRRSARALAEDVPDEEREARNVRASSDRVKGVEAFLNRRPPPY